VYELREPDGVDCNFKLSTCGYTLDQQWTLTVVFGGNNDPAVLFLQRLMSCLFDIDI